MQGESDDERTRAIQDAYAQARPAINLVSPDNTPEPSPEPTSMQIGGPLPGSTLSPRAPNLADPASSPPKSERSGVEEQATTALDPAVAGGRVREDTELKWEEADEGWDELGDDIVADSEAAWKRADEDEQSERLKRKLGVTEMSARDERIGKQLMAEFGDEGVTKFEQRMEREREIETVVVRIARYRTRIIHGDSGAMDAINREVARATAEYGKDVAINIQQRATAMGDPDASLPQTMLDDSDSEFVGGQNDSENEFVGGYAIDSDDETVVGHVNDLGGLNAAEKASWDDILKSRMIGTAMPTNPIMTYSPAAAPIQDAQSSSAFFHTSYHRSAGVRHKFAIPGGTVRIRPSEITVEIRRVTNSTRVELSRYLNGRFPMGAKVDGKFYTNALLANAVLSRLPGRVTISY